MSSCYSENTYNTGGVADSSPGTTRGPKMQSRNNPGGVEEKGVNSIRIACPASLTPCCLRFATAPKEGGNLFHAGY